MLWPIHLRLGGPVAMLLRVSSGWPGGIHCPHQVAPAADSGAAQVTADPDGDPRALHGDRGQP